MTELIISDQVIPILNDEPIKVTRAITDIKDPSIKTGTYSKSFRCPGTEAVNKLFNHLFEVNIEVTSTVQFTPDFNPNLKADATVMTDGLTVFNGYVRLVDVTVMNDTSIVYTLQASSDLANLINDLGDAELTDLDLSAYNHAYTMAVLRGTWTNDYTDGYVYPLVNYGNYGGALGFNPTDFRPAVFVKMLWDEIMSSINWSYSSAFLDATSHGGEFGKLILPFSNESMLLSNSEISDRTFIVGNGSTQNVDYGVPKKLTSAQIALFNKITAPTDTGTITGNTLKNTSGTDYDTTTSIYTAPNNTKEGFRIFFDAELTYNGANQIKAGISVWATILLIRIRGGVYSIVGQVETDLFTFTGIINNGDQSNNTVTVNTAFIEFDVEANDQYYFAVGWVRLTSDVYPYYGAAGDWELNIAADMVFGNIPTNQIDVGDNVVLSSMLPTKIKQKDFIKGIADMYNLYFEQTDPNVMLIEPFVDYYNNTHNDWSQKIDTSQEVKVIPMGELNARNYLFSYSEDRDFGNDRYTTSFGEIYGQKKHVVNNDFLTETKEIKPIFAASVMSDRAQLDDWVVPDIRFLDKKGDPNPGSAKIRILYYGGVKTAIPPYSLFTKPNPDPVADFYSNEGTYPYAGHADDPWEPTKDLLFASPRAIYYDSNSGYKGSPSYSNQGLFNRFWARYIFEITNKNSKVLEAFFHLTFTDYVNLSFRELYFINGANYRLLEVSDFNLSGGELTYCRLLKVDPQLAPASDTKVLYGGEEEWDNDNDGAVPMMIRQATSDNNSSRTGVGSYQGMNNVQEGLMGVIYGNNNIVPASTQGYAIMNSSGITALGNGATAINSRDRVIYRENEVWINDINYTNFIDITLDSAAVIDLFANPLEILPDCGANQFWVVKNVMSYYDYNSVAFSPADAMVIRTNTTNTTLSSASSTITGAADKYSMFLTPTAITGDFGEGVELVNTVESLSGDGTLRIKVYYELIEF